MIAKAIAAGEELLLNYGPNYWNDEHRPVLSDSDPLPEYEEEERVSQSHLTPRPPQAVTRRIWDDDQTGNRLRKRIAAKQTVTQHQQCTPKRTCPLYYLYHSFPELAEFAREPLQARPSRRMVPRAQRAFHVPLRIGFQSLGDRTELALRCADRPGLR